MIFTKKKPGLANHLKDIPGSQGGIHNMLYLIQNTKEEENDNEQ